MPTIDWDTLRHKLNKRARYMPGLVVKWRGRTCRIYKRYWRYQSNVFVYDLREIGTDGMYVANHHQVNESELTGR
ncbi:MAG TPA: hypothetical protein PK760_11495 [Flavobacteriales bacterium]|nr:hypothetical protein [Flavobacteriales bacterium]